MFVDLSDVQDELGLRRAVAAFMSRRLGPGARLDASMFSQVTVSYTHLDVYKRQLLRSAQSALANVRLHANATRVVMTLVDADRSVRLDIMDDGQGFDVPSWEQRSEAGSPSYGLRFMRDRLRELGGGLDIESTPGEGTAISVSLPVHRDRSPLNKGEKA